MTTSRVTIFTLSKEDSAGILADMLNRFKEEKTDLAGLWAWTEGKNANFMLVGKDPIPLRKSRKRFGWEASESEGFFVEEHDRLGALTSVTNAIAEAGISLRGAQIIGVGGKVGCYLWVDNEDLEKAARILNA